MTLLEADRWTGQVFVDGWEPGGGGDYAVIGARDRRRARPPGRGDRSRTSPAPRPAPSEAQRAWADTMYQERAAILRKAGDLWNQHSEEVVGWIVRETGAIPPKGELEMWFAASTCYESAGLVSLPYGELLRTRDPILSMSRRVPVGVVGVISPFNFPLILSIRAVAPALALGNAVILKPDPRTSVSGGVTLARIFEEAGLPDGLFSVLPGGADIGEALVREPKVDMVSFTGSSRGRQGGRRDGRGEPEAHPPGARRQQRDDRAGRRRSREGRVGGGVRLVHAPGPDLHDDRPAPGAAQHRRRVRREARRARRPPAGRRSERRTGRARARSSTRSSATACTDLVTASVDKGARIAAGGTYEGLFYRPTVLADVPTDSPAWMEEIFGPVAPVVRVRFDRRRGEDRRRHAVRTLARASSRTT